MSLHDALLSLYPDYEPGDWVVQDNQDGTGYFIAKWNRTEPQPPLARLNAVSQSERDNASKNARFKRSFPVSDSRNKALITWIAGKHGLTFDEALAEIQIIWNAL